MSTYLEYFRKNYEQTEIYEMKGICLSMCPQEEIKLREAEKLVHVLEVWGTERKLVKSYCRSAADSHMAVPHLLRPYPILYSTVQYLLLDVTKRTDVPQSVVYDFVNDRLRAVRQDMTIQRLPPDECVHLLEPMLRFYVYYGHLLSNMPTKDYDPILNKKTLLDCTKWCLSCYDSIVPRPDGDVIDRLTNYLCKLDVNTKLACDRVLVECLYILCNLGDVHPFHRFYRLPTHIRREPKLQLSYSIALANYHGNFVRACRLVEKLCPLTYCAFFSSLPNIQRNALRVLTHAYHNKKFTVPTQVISEWLRFSDVKEAEQTCIHYGLRVEGAAVLFDKTTLKVDVDLHKLETKNFKTKLNIKNMAEIYTYVTNK